MKMEHLLNKILICILCLMPAMCTYIYIHDVTRWGERESVYKAKGSLSLCLSIPGFICLSADLSVY